MDTRFAPGIVVLDSYRLRALLGAGPGGECWRASPLDGGAPVAVKVIADAAGHGLPRPELLREVSRFQAVEHPAVLQYLGALALPHTDATCVVTPYVAGGNLHDFLRARRGPCTPELAARLLLPVAQGIAAMHGAGVLHRGLKPTNVLLDPSDGPLPRIRVADGGLSRRAARDRGWISRQVVAMGYTAPESFGEDPLDRPADVYGLGALFWFLCLGADPTPPLGSLVPDPDDLVARLPGGVLTRSRDAVALGAAMIARDPARRPDLAEVRRRFAELAAEATDEPLVVAPRVTHEEDRPPAAPPEFPPLPGARRVALERASRRPPVRWDAVGGASAVVMVVAAVAWSAMQPPARGLVTDGVARVAELRAGLEGPVTLPNQGVLALVAPDGGVHAARGPVLNVRDVAAGRAVIEVRAAGAVLGATVVDLPAAASLDVRCSATDTRFTDLYCAVR